MVSSSSEALVAPSPLHGGVSAAHTVPYNIIHTTPYITTAWNQSEKPNFSALQQQLAVEQ